MWLKQEHTKGCFRVEYLPTEHILADGLTKVLLLVRFEYFRRLLNLYDMEEVLNRAQNNIFCEVKALKYTPVKLKTTVV